MRVESLENTKNHFYLNTIRGSLNDNSYFLKARQVARIDDSRIGECLVVYERYNYGFTPANSEDTRHLTFYLLEQPEISSGNSMLQVYGTNIQILFPQNKTVAFQPGGNWCWQGANFGRYGRVLIEPLFEIKPWQALYIISFGDKPVKANLLKGQGWLGVNFPASDINICFLNIISPNNQTPPDLPVASNVVIVPAVSLIDDSTSEPPSKPGKPQHIDAY
jgi:hypothetical protein